MQPRAHIQSIVQLSLVFVSLLALGACSHTPIPPTFEAGKIDAGRVVPKVDEFVVVVDGSLSMSDYSAGQKKLEIATAVATGLVKTVPAGVLPGSVRSFGQGRCLPGKKTASLYGDQDFVSADAAGAIGLVSCAGGGSPLDEALDATGDTLLSSPKKLAVFMMSDGLHMGKNEVLAAQRLNEDLQGGVCFYPIQVGFSGAGAQLLSEIVATSGCGGTVNASELFGADAMTAFAKTALFDDDSDGDGVADGVDRCPNTPAGVRVDDHGCSLDSDGDGVPDYLDACADTPRGMTVDAKGCPLDSDGDGVTDDSDDCPNTPPNTRVDDRGCAMKHVEVEGAEWHVDGEVLFDLDKSEIRPEAEIILEKIAVWLESNKDVSLLIEGHTDSSGREAYNQELSERRADSVKAFLIDQGVGEVRLRTVGKGEFEPLVANDSAANRKRNRRVEMKPVR